METRSAYSERFCEIFHRDVDAEAHQQPSLKQHLMNHEEGIAAAADFLIKLDGWGGRHDSCAGKVSTSPFLQLIREWSC